MINGAVISQKSSFCLSNYSSYEKIHVRVQYFWLGEEGGQALWTKLNLTKRSFEIDATPC